MPKEERTHLTELEGAVLTEIGHRGNHTAFRVRRAFETSPSSSWSGSAGAVYPAIRRLTDAGLILADADGSRRGTRILSLSEKGRAALEYWCCDAAIACAIGIDPFRLRAGLWNTLSGDRRRTMIAALRAAIEVEMAKLTDRDDLDPVERAGNDLAIEAQSLRLRWIDRFEHDTDNLPKRP